MAWGGRRPGAGRKPRPTNSPKPVERPSLKAGTKLPATAPAEPMRTDLPAIDPQVWASFLPQLEEISRKYATNKARSAENNPFRLPSFPPRAIPKGQDAQQLAMDSATSWASSEWLSGEVIAGLPAEGLVFLGYPYLSELAQRPEYRVMSETIADDATRKWIDFDVVGDKKKQAEERAKDPQGYDERMADPDERQKRLKAADKLDKVKALKDDQLRLGLKERLYEQARNDGFFGRSHLFLDIMTTPGAEPSDEELITPIGNGRDATSVSKVPKGSLRALRTIEPVWTYPQMYNAINPLREDWYNPQQWYVMGKQIHISRLPTFIGHPVPDLLKPAYSFGGLSLTQMAKPYVDMWLQTRQSVADLIHSFSVMVLMTDLSTLMQPQNANALLARIAMFNMLRDNQGTFVVNKNTEDFKNVSAQLSGLHELQAQSQEHMASVHRIPLVKFTGIQPAGLNASSEGEIEVYDDTIGAYQTRFFDPNLRKIIYFEMLSLWGEIDPEITYHWEKLREITQAEKGQKEKDDADRDVKYIDAGVLAPQEVRARIIDDADLPYADLDPDEVPEPPQEEGLDEPGAPDAENDNEPEQPPRKEAGAQDSLDPFGATDEWREEDHPRAENGQFGSGEPGAPLPQTKILAPDGTELTPEEAALYVEGEEDLDDLSDLDDPVPGESAP